jgi:2-haloacid dehalogenase
VEVEAVVFDMGGVLLDWDPRHLYRKVFDDDDAVERFLTDLELISWHVANHDSGARSMVESSRELGERYPDYRDELALWGPCYPEMIGGPIDGMVDLVAELRGRTRLYLLSNAPAEPIDQVIADWPFLSWFDGYVVSGRERIMKPDPRLFRLLLDRFDLEPAATMFVDDLEANVTGAAAVGIQAVRFESAPQLRAALVDAGVLD